jgi:H+/Cl- antiporter ClcA
VKRLAQWIGLGAVSGVLSGLASAAFLWSLDRATEFRLGHEFLVYLLPVAGLLIGLAYARWGTPIKDGTSLVIVRQREGGPEIPLRVAPMVLVGTVLTHLFGGSAGREGTAVQMGASLTDFVSHRLKLDAELRRHLIAAGVAGGFGSVFGTPFAGALFAMEFVVVGRVQWVTVVPCVVAAFVGDLTTRGLGIGHTAYPQVAALEPTLLVVGKWLLFALAIVAAAVAFIELSKRIKALKLPLPAKMVGAGVVVVAIWQVFDADDALGLGVPTIVRAFGDPQLPQTLFLLKLVLTAVTVGAGFLGGEVTPLFFIGATMGNVLARALGLPLELGAGVGMAAMFAVCSNAPLALSVMAIELLGWSVAPHVLLVCAVAQLLNRGRRSIYPAQVVK